MAGSMKLFLFFRKIHQTVGIHAPQQFQKQFSIKSQNAIFLFCIGQYTLTAVEFLVFEENSLFTIGLAFYTFLCLIASTVYYLIFIWQNGNALSFIQNCEKFIENSE